jgi:hypothetical protein
MTSGLLDPIYFAFYEEIDFCRRASLHGWETRLATRSRIHHYRGGSWAADPVVKRERDYRCDRSQFIYNLTEPRRTMACKLRLVFHNAWEQGQGTAEGLHASQGMGPLTDAVRCPWQQRRPLWQMAARPKCARRLEPQDVVGA